MNGAQQPPGPFRFGVFELDLRAGELRKHGMRIRLQDQPFQVLCVLVRRPGEIVTREELRNALWPADTFVDFDHGVNKAINKIRGALGDLPNSPRFVETVARRGYRFLAEVSVATPSSATETGVHRRRVSPVVWRMSISALALALLVLIAWRLRLRNNGSQMIHSLAVLPLENLTGDASQDYFADGMTDELITDLSQISAIRVISRTSIMMYKGARKPLPEIARELSVDAVVEGTVSRSGNQVRITAQLIQGPVDKHLWARSYEGDLRNPLALQNEVASAIAQEVRIKLTPRERIALATAQAVNPDGYEAYLKGRYFWNKRTADGLQKAIEYFNESLNKDQGYARAYAGLADSYALLGDNDFAVMSPRDAYAKAKAAAARAMELEPTLGEAHTSYAFCLGLFEWDWDAAEKEYQRAIALNPGYATAHQWYALQLSALGRSDQAIAEMKQAQSLDPLSLIIGTDMADVLFAARRYDQSIQQSRRIVEMEPDFAIAHYELGQALVQENAYGAGIAELQRANQLAGGNATCLAGLACAYALSGRRAEAIRVLHELATRSNRFNSFAAHQAWVHVCLGDKDSAMASLEKAYANHFDVLLLRSPAFDPLRSDPRFQDLLRRMHLPH